MNDSFPYPEGTLVMGVLPNGLPLRTSCETHIFITISPPMPVTDYTECGFIQAAKCLVCCYATAALDAEFWHKQADGMDLAGLSGELHEAIEHYLATLDLIGKKMTGQETGLKAID